MHLKTLLDTYGSPLPVKRKTRKGWKRWQARLTRAGEVEVATKNGYHWRPAIAPVLAQDYELAF